MFSFYGGKPGNSFVIVKSFPSINSMKESFETGPSYTKVHIGEYVIIDTTDKNDPDNGKIYKRGTNYQNGFGGGEYFAQIVGPSGQAAYIHYDSFHNVDIIADEQEGKIITKEEGEAESSLNYQNGTLVPGKYNLPDYQGGTTQYNDKLRWKICKVRDINNRTEDFYIGFQIPYLVTDFIVTSVSPQTSLSIEKTNAGNDHPFYDEWNINIPRAKQGNEIKNIRPYDLLSGPVTYVEPYGDRTQDYATGHSGNPRWIWIGDYYDYSQSENPEPKVIYLGKYSVPKQIEILSDGKIKTLYTNKLQNGNISETTENSIVKWPTNIHVDTGMTGEGDGDQKIYINWNDNTQTIIGDPINYILEATVDNQNRLLVRYSDPQRRRSSNITYNGKTGWTNIGLIGTDINTLNEINAIVQKEYSNGETFKITNIVNGFICLSAANNFLSNASYLNFYVPHNFIKINNMQKMNIKSGEIIIQGFSAKDLTINNQNLSVETAWLFKKITKNSNRFSLNRFEIENAPSQNGLKFTIFLTSDDNEYFHNLLNNEYGNDFPLNYPLIVPIRVSIGIVMQIISTEEQAEYNPEQTLAGG